MDYNLIKGFCKKYAIKPLVFHDDNCFTAEMTGGKADVGPCRELKKKSGRQRAACIMYLPHKIMTTEELIVAKTRLIFNERYWKIGKVGFCIHTHFTISRSHFPYVMLSVMAPGWHKLPLCLYFWEWDEPEAIAARDVVLSKQPPEMFLDWLQERNFGGDSPAWQRAMKSLVAT